MSKGITVGQVVKSKSGRDKGRYYLVKQVLPDKKAVLLVDGNSKLLKKPKKKNILHLQVTNTIASELAVKLHEGLESCDQEIKRYLKEFQVD